MNIYSAVYALMLMQAPVIPAPVATVPVIAAPVQTVPPLPTDVAYVCGSYTDLPGSKVAGCAGYATLLSKSIGSYLGPEIDFLRNKNGTLGYQTTMDGWIFLRNAQLKGWNLYLFALVGGGITATSTATTGALLGGGILDIVPPNSKHGYFVAYKDSTSTGWKFYGGWNISWGKSK